MEYVWRSSSGLERRGRAANVVKLRVILMIVSIYYICFLFVVVTHLKF